MSRPATVTQRGKLNFTSPTWKQTWKFADLEANLEILAERNIAEADYWNLKFIIHVHDLFKSEAQRGTPTLHPKNHASLAKAYASQFTNDTEILNIIQFHDENYKLWRDYLQTGSYLLDTIQNWDIFLMFIIIDGCTEGKDLAKLSWFIDEIRKHKETRVDSSWVIPPERFRAKKI